MSKYLLIGVVVLIAFSLVFMSANNTPPASFADVFSGFVDGIFVLNNVVDSVRDFIIPPDSDSDVCYLMLCKVNGDKHFFIVDALFINDSSIGQIYDVLYSSYTLDDVSKLFVANPFYFSFYDSDNNELFSKLILKRSRYDNYDLAYQAGISFITGD